MPENRTKRIKHELGFMETATREPCPSNGLRVWALSYPSLSLHTSGSVLRSGVLWAD